jgi:HK97 family phage major capsid protein
MSDYNQIVERTGLSAALNRPEYLNEIFEGTISQSAVLRMGRRLPNMARQKTEMTVLDSLPSAYFVSGDTGLKKTTKQAWKGKTLHAEELACIVPMPKAVLDDTDIQLSDISIRISEACAATIDDAVIFGNSLPNTWMTTTAGVSQSIVTGATAAGNTVESGSGIDLYDDILGTGGVFSKVEADRYRVDAWAANPLFASQYRHVRVDRTNTGAGMPLFVNNDGGGVARLDGIGGVIVDHEKWDDTQAVLIAGNSRQLVFAFRQELTFDLFDTGVINDDEGAIVYNLLQQDMVAFRAVMRIGVQIANPVHRGATVEANRYPFAVLTPAGT